MAYRRRSSAKMSSMFEEDVPSSPSHDDGSWLAARAIRASSLHRDSSFSIAYGENERLSPRADTLKGWETPPQQSSRTYEYTPMKSLNEPKSGLWGVLARKAKTIFEEENGLQKFESLGRGGPWISEASDGPGSQFHRSYQSTEFAGRMENPKIQKSLGAIASSLDYIGGKLGNALEEGFSIAETKAADIISDTGKVNIRRKANPAVIVGQTQQPIHPVIKNRQLPAGNIPATLTDFDTQLKASRDVAMAMTAKTKVLLRELKSVKADLAFAKQRSTQLEEEKKILRESTEKGDCPEDDDLIRLQLETLLAEKARLAHENSVYARENRFLREVVEYHQLTMQDVVYVDEGIEEVKEVCPIHIPFEPQLDLIRPSEKVFRPSPDVVTVSSVFPALCAPPDSSSPHPET